MPIRGSLDDRSDEPERLEELTKGECLRLMREQPVGRLALTREDDAPLVVPVNFVLAEDEILFRTNPGSKLELAHGAVVSFQVDFIEPVRKVGWSVLVIGHAYDATDWEIDRGALEAWAGGARDNWVRIVIGQVSGRRIRAAHLPPLDKRGYL